MSSAIKLDRDKLTIDLGHLYDHMDEHTRLEFLDLVCGHARLIEHVCQAVGGGCAVEPIFFNDLRDRCLKALLPLLDKAAAESLSDALAKAEKYEKAESQLRGMAHVHSMMREDEGELKERRREQWQDCLQQMRTMYPEYETSTSI